VLRWLFVWGPAASLMAVIFAASSVPHLDTTSSGISDKTLHVWTYGALGALLVRALAGAAWTGVTSRVAGLAWVIAVAWGALDEWHQSIVPGRSLSSRDLVADAIGAALAVAVVLLVARRQGGGRAV